MADYPIPTDSTEVSIEQYPDATLVHFDSATVGEAYLTFDFATQTWDGVLELPNGVIEFAAPDGSFSMYGAIGLDDLPVEPNNFPVTEGVTDPIDYTFAVLPVTGTLDNTHDFLVI